MQERFNRHVTDEHLFPEGEQVLLAVSGGRDSVTLCHLVAKAGIPFAIAHCNFHLRPGDCDRDEAFVRQLASRYGVSCFIAQFETTEYARSKQLSVEEAARKLRYAFFDEVCRREGYAIVATAHHRDDAIETFFINLLRGTGIRGLHGIPQRNGNIVRPLLPFGRDEIDRYVAENGLEYVEDYTNSQPLYLRNKIRHQLIPLLRELSPSFDATMQDNLRHIGEAEQIYNAAVDTARLTLLQPHNDGYELDIEALKALSPTLTYLYELLRPFGFTTTVCEEIIKSLDAQSGKQFLSPTHRVIKDRNRLLLVPLKRSSVQSYVILSPEQYEPEALPITMQISEKPEGPIRLTPNQAWFDLDKTAFPLTLRHPQPSDRFRPFGMNGTRLVSDLLTDHKVSIDEKERIWLLCDAEGNILWVAGFRASAIAPVTAATQQVLQVSL